MNLASRFLALALSFSLVLFTAPANSQEEYAPVSDSDLDALVAPIALYPDALVAQVLGAATFPDQVVEANDFLKSNSGLKGEALQRAVEQRTWDPAVQALTQFPSVLDNLAKNISWTSALGEASALQQEATLAAVQRMRAKAYAAGSLKSSNEIKVVQQSPQVIVIQPANPQVVYVPTYNPTVIYGAPVSTPGYSTGDVVAASIISFGIGVAVGAAISNSSCGYSYWGWGMSWGVRTISCGGGYYYGNPYWWGGYYPGYRPGYRPPYYPPPRPPYWGGRPPYPPGNGRPPYPRPTPLPAPGRPNPGKPTPLPAPTPRPTPNPGKPPTILPVPNPRPTPSPNPGKPPTTLPAPTPRPTPGKPITTLPAPTPRPAPAPRPTPGKPSILPAPEPLPSPGPSTRPSNQSYRGYQQTPPAKPAATPSQKPNAFSGSAGGRPQSARGNRSMSSKPAGGAGKR